MLWSSFNITLQETGGQLRGDWEFYLVQENLFQVTVLYLEIVCRRIFSKHVLGKLYPYCMYLYPDCNAQGNEWGLLFFCWGSFAQTEQNTEGYRMENFKLLLEEVYPYCKEYWVILGRGYWTENYTQIGEFKILCLGYCRPAYIQCPRVPEFKFMLILR